MSVNIPIWAIGIGITLFLAFMGMVVAHVKAFTKLSENVGYLSTSVAVAGNSIINLSTSITTLASDVRMLNSAVEKIPGLERVTKQLELDIFELRAKLE